LPGKLPMFFLMAKGTKTLNTNFRVLPSSDCGTCNWGVSATVENLKKDSVLNLLPDDALYFLLADDEQINAAQLVAP
jgi:hypothetical protein